MGLGDLMYDLQSNQPNDIIIKSEEDKEEDSSSIFQPQTRQQPKQYPLNPQVPNLEVICIEIFYIFVLHHNITCCPQLSNFVVAKLLCLYIEKLNF